MPTQLARNLQKKKPATSAFATRGALLFAIPFVGIWTAVTLAFVILMGRGTVQQAGTVNYRPVAATLTRSEVEDKNDGDGSTFRWLVTYTYAIDGKQFTGNKYRYEQHGSNDRWAYRMLEAHPVNSPMTAYYNPANPADSVLVRGIEGSDLMMALFITPFVCIMLGGWSVLLSLFGWKRLVSGNGGFRAFERADGTHVTLPEHWPGVRAAVAVAASAFVLIFVVAFGFGGFHPSLSVMIAIWTLLACLTVGTYLRYQWPLWNGDADLILSPGGTVTLPKTQGRAESINVQPGDITGVTVERVTNKLNAGEKYAPTLYRRNEEDATTGECLVACGTEADAECFADWLRQKLAYPAYTG